MKILTLLLLTSLFGSTYLREHSDNHAHQAIAALDKNTPGPVIKAEVNTNNINLLRIQSDSSRTKQRAVFPKGSVLSVTAHSTHSGSPEIYIAFNKAHEQLYREPIKLTAKGRHTLKIRAIDPEGNESSLVFTYLIIE